MKKKDGERKEDMERGQRKRKREEEDKGREKGGGGGGKQREAGRGRREEREDGERTNSREDRISVEATRQENVLV